MKCIKCGKTGKKMGTLKYCSDCYNEMKNEQYREKYYEYRETKPRKKMTPEGMSLIIGDIKKGMTDTEIYKSTREVYRHSFSKKNLGNCLLTDSCIWNAIREGRGAVNA